MLNPRARAVLAAYAVVSIVQVIARGIGPEWLAGVTQVLLMPLLLLALLAQTTRPRTRLVTLTLGAPGVCVPGAGVLAPAVLVYGLCLGAMAVLATGVDRLAWVGGAFFLVSDGLIAIDAFSDLGLPAHDVSVMATYVVAQLLLLLGVIRRGASAAPPDSPASSGRGSSAAPDARRTTPRPATPAP